MELAASHEGLPEPDYGLVAELRNKAGPDPFASDYGLAAEVARRRSRSRSPSPSPLMRGRLGVLPPLRARRRLDPVMPAEDLDAEIAARQRAQAAAMAEPFTAADGSDPFALAAGDEQLKLPRELMTPYEPSQQELPGDDVRLKTPGDDASETSHVSRDDELYGLAAELGVDPETARRLRDERRAQGLDPYGNPLPGQPGGEPPEPPGHKYVYDEDTGMLVNTGGGQGVGDRKARQYIEDEVTGDFYKLHSKRRRLLGLLRRKEPAANDDDEDEEDDRGFRGRLRRSLANLTNIFNILGMFAQGLLSGFALLNFFMTYMLYGSSGGELREFLRYYGPLAQNNNRLYYTLLALSVISSTSRLARDKLRGFQPRRLLLAPVDYGQMLLYVGAYIASVLCTPLDDELTYEYNRNPRFYELTFASGFKKRLSLWHLLNIVRTVLCALAWLLTCYQNSPHVFEATLRAEIRSMRRQQQLLHASGPAAATAGQGALVTSASEGGTLRRKAA
ncbi:hypothetical protein GPECTOR_43g867 [Gonium pectorale]|uniref:Uncharacterized protein n=1 Tax=Gonium pectorale TaxID=33097 RepID=A0A150G9C5_GONPE|nr:hypothetical protein GPECTOR_43g867 [Gonium pectorale]|eukprot:KXZ46431.1 hypothetical protein GPECTOR_43g867 [Gonium pectorale]